MAKQQNQRKRLFVDNEVQSALVRRVLFHWLLFVGITFCLTGFLQTCVEAPSFAFWDIFSTFWSNNSISLIMAFALLPVFVFDVIKLSNRFAGPILRLRSGLESLADGQEPEPLNFREGDFWNQIANNFNKAFQLKSNQNTSADEVKTPADS